MKIEEFKTLFSDLGDTMIKRVELVYYPTKSILRNVVITLHSQNYLLNYKYQIVELYFTDVKYYRFLEDERTNVSVFEAAYAYHKGLIVFDFEGNWKPDSNLTDIGSSLLLSSKEFDFKILGDLL